MNHFHKPTDEKRMVAILPAQSYRDWLDATAPILEFMLPYPADAMQVIEQPTSNKGLFA
jgi:hypothetical protein